MTQISFMRWVGFAVLVGCVFAERSVAADAPPADVVRIMTYNLFHGGDGGKQPLEQTAKVIRDAKADVVGMQEAAGFVPPNSPKGTPRPDHGAKLAEMLGFQYYKQPSLFAGSNISVMSRYPIVGTVGENKLGVTIQLPSKQQISLFNVHLKDSPYQPYQLLNIPYGNAPMLKTAGEAIAAANKVRRPQIETLLAAIKLDLAPVTVVTGDLNEPSCLDWTPAAVTAKQQPLAVEWPATKALLDAGFVDSYRKVFPDPVKQPGLTWTPATQVNDPKDHHDRIDFIMIRGNADVQGVEIVGESKDHADIVVAPYPSDHRAVVATLTLPKQ